MQSQGTGTGGEVPPPPPGALPEAAATSAEAMAAVREAWGGGGYAGRFTAWSCLPQVHSTVAGQHAFVPAAGLLLDRSEL